MFVILPSTVNLVDRYSASFSMKLSTAFGTALAASSVNGAVLQPRHCTPSHLHRRYQKPNSLFQTPSPPSQEHPTGRAFAKPSTSSPTQASPTSARSKSDATPQALDQPLQPLLWPQGAVCPSRRARTSSTQDRCNSTWQRYRVARRPRTGTEVGRCGSRSMRRRLPLATGGWHGQA